MNTEGRNLNVLFRILSSHQEQVRFADSKATFVAALNALLFGFMATHFVSLQAIYTTVWPAEFRLLGTVRSSCTVRDKLDDFLVARSLGRDASLWGACPAKQDLL